MHQGVVFIEIQKGDPEDRAVGGDEGQVHTECLVQSRRGLEHDHLDKLHEDSDDQDKGDGAQIKHIKGHEQVGLNAPSRQRGYRHDKDDGETHADGSFYFF